VNDALVVDKLAFAWRPNSLCIELLNPYYRRRLRR